MQRHKATWQWARIAIAIATTAALGTTNPAHAEYPERLIRAIVPFATGGTTDITARMISQHLSKAFNQQVVIENRPGAAGNIGIEAAAKSTPDGYTLLFNATAATQNPALFRNLRFDPLTDIQPVAPIAEYPYAVVVNAHLPVKNVRELVALAQKNPAKLNASAGGIGTRLSVELFGMRNNVRIEIITYNGTGVASLAIATGETQVAISDTTPFLPYLASGRVRVLAFASDRRLPTFPDVSRRADGRRSRPARAESRRHRRRLYRGQNPRRHRANAQRRSEQDHCPPRGEGTATQARRQFRTHQRGGLHPVVPARHSDVEGHRGAREDCVGGLSGRIADATSFPYSSLFQHTEHPP